MNKKIVHSVFEHIVATYPDQVAVAESTGAAISYRDLNRRANAVARLLSANGSGRDSLTGLLLPAGIGYTASIFGTLKTGGLFMPLELGLPRPRLRHILEHTRPRLILTDAASRPELAAMLAEFGLAEQIGVLLLEEAGEGDDANPPLVSEPDDSCYVIYTSGSTGVPKFIEGWHKGLAHYCHWQATEFGLGPADRISQMAPVTFEASLKDYFVALCCGATLCIPAPEVKENPARLMEWIEESGLTLFQTVPSFLRLVTREAAAQERDGGFFPRLRLVFQSGDTLYGKDVNQWRRVIGPHAELVNLYGPAEVTLLKSFHRIGPEELKPNEIVPIGLPISNTVILILSNDTLCPPGKIGEICVKSPFIVKGYYRSPELTAERFVQNPLNSESRDIIYRTGDLGRYRADMVIEFVGRMDSQVKVHGNRIELAEIENVLLSCPKIGQAVVVPHRTEEMENMLACYYTEQEPVSQAELRELLLSRLPDYMVPAWFIPMATLPLSLNGKVDRKALPKPEELVIGSYEPPVSPTEEGLAEIWQEVLGLRRVGRENRFIEIGGDSLKAIRVIARIYKLFGVEVSVRDFFAAPTIRELALFVDNGRQQRYEPIPAIPDAESYELSHAQRRLWLLDRMEQGTAAYTIASAFLIEGAFSPDAFRKAVLEIHRRHETLRTVFTTVDGLPRQVVRPGGEPALELRDLSHLPDPEAAARELFRDEAVRPFDLEQGPLCRTVLVTLGPQRTAFVFVIHHIISDVWSLGVMTDELSRLYNGFLRDEPVPLPSLAIQYRDFAHWQNRQLAEHGAVDADRAYWLQQLAGPLPLLDLPADFPRPVVKSHNGATVRLRLDAGLSGQLRALAVERGASLFALLTALVRVLVYRYTGGEELVIGTPVAGRTHPDLEPQIGFFLNTLALRDRVGGEERFIDLLDRVMATNTAAFDHQGYPFDRLVDELALPRDVSRSPVFDLMVVLQNAGQVPFSLEGAVVTELAHLDEISKFDLDFVFQESGEEIELLLEYNRDLFLPQRMERLAGHFLTLAEGVAAEPQRPVRELPLLSPPELDRILHDFNGTAADWPREATLVSLFREQAARTPHRTAVSFQGQTASYADLTAEAERVAALIRRQGIGPGEIVAIIAEPALMMPAWLLGILCAGCAYLPMDPGYPEERLRYMLEDSGARLLLAQGEAIKGLSRLALRGIDGPPPLLEQTPARPPIRELDLLPFPDRGLVDHDRYHRFIGQSMVKHAVALQASRGCPYQCAYCHRIWPRTHVCRSAENLFAEVKELYDLGVRRFVFIDDIFNLNRENSSRFFRLVIEQGLKIQIHFPNGLRGDLLTPDYIDLMVAAGTVSFALALETASPRLQALIGKNLNLEKLRETISYITERHPQVILELFTMHGFPTESEEEARSTLDFIRSVRWLHFPYVHILKIFPGSDMEQLALDNGISADAIRRSHALAFHQLPETLPFDPAFTKQYQAEFFNGYFLDRQRLLAVLPHQMRVLTEDELVQKYDSYLPLEIRSFDQLLDFFGIGREELGDAAFADEAAFAVPDLSRRYRQRHPLPPQEADPLRVLLLDLSQLYSAEAALFYDVVEPPLGLISLGTVLNRRFGGRVAVRVAKSRIDFDSSAGLRELLEECRPQLIGIRTLSLYQEFFHDTVALLRRWGITAPVVAGGPYATSSVGQVLNDPGVDLVVVGEGEETLAELVEKLLGNGGLLPDEETLRGMAGIAFVPRNVPRRSRDLVLLEEPSGPLAAPGPLDLPAPSPSDAAYVIYTSGSTGRPKGVVVEHRNVVRLLFNNRLPFDFSEEDVWIQSHSFCFDFSVWEMYGALLRGGRLVMPKREEVRDMARYQAMVREEGVTVLNQTPAAFYGFIDAALRGDHPWDRQLRYVIFGGDRLEPAHLRRWAEQYPATALINMYGITETTVHVTFHRLTPEELAAASGKSPVGRPIPETTVYVCDGSLNLLPIGVPGELYVGGSGVSRGYLNRPDLTAERFIPDPFCTGGRLYKTGDLGRWGWDGGLEYLGRNDHQVQIRGFRVELGEIESRLLEHPAVKECVVLALTGEQELLTLAAWVVFSRGATVAELREYLADKLADYMIPAWFTPLEKLPLTSNGKIDRAALPDPRGNTAPALELGSVYEAPRTDLERTVAAVWEGVLGRAPIGINDNYFALGGDSIRAIQVVSRLQQQGLKAEMLDIFQFPTVAGLAGRVTGLTRLADQGTVTGEVGLTPVQHWFFREHGAGLHHYNQAVLLAAPEPLREELLRPLLTALTEQHDMLRTAFIQGEGEWHQQVLPPGTPPRFELVDLRSDPDPAAALARHAAGLQAGFNLAAPPLLAAALYRLPQGDRLLLTIHHLVVDGVSWRILAEDLIAGYGALNRGEPLRLPPKSDSFRLWSRELHRYAASGDLLGELGYWRELARTAATLPPLPLQEGMGRGTVADFDEMTVTLPAADTARLLTEANRAYGTDAVELLLAALALALADWSGSSRHLITLEGHGREDIGAGIDLSRTVGWFTTLYPHLLELADREEPGYRLRVIKEGFRAVPKRGLGYGLLRWLTPPELCRREELPPLPRISFNYLGSFDADYGNGPFVPCNEPHGGTVAPVCAMDFDLELTCLVQGGELSVSLRHDRRLLDGAAARLLADRLLVRVRELLDHCCTQQESVISPSDIGYDGLDIDQLDALLEGLGRE